MKRKWSSTAGLVDLGLSRSTLRALDSAESAMEVVECASADIRRAGIAQTGVGLPGVLGGMVDIRVGGAAAGLAAAFPDVGAHAAAALGKPNMDLAGEGLKGILGGRFKDIAGVASAKDLALCKAPGPYPAAFDGMSDLFKGASPLSSTFKAADLAGTIPKKSATLGFSVKMLGADLSAARSAASFFGARKKTDDLIASARKPGWKDGLLLSGWKIDLLSSVAPKLSERLGMAGAVKDSGALRNTMGLSGTDWLYGPPRELGLLGKLGAAGGPTARQKATTSLRSPGRARRARRPARCLAPCCRPGSARTATGPAPPGPRRALRRRGWPARRLAPTGPPDPRRARGSPHAT